MNLLTSIQPFVDAGFAIHWLRSRSKAPIEKEWQDQSRATFDSLAATYRQGNNVGVRLGEPSLTRWGYLHAIDLDIRVADLADEVWEKLEELLPGARAALPIVQSGSGGESRHLHFVTSKPFRSKKLAASEGKFRRFDTAQGRDVWSREWEIELFGTGKQVAMPPSIHPDTGLPYSWVREFDFDGFDDFPSIPAARLEELAVAEDVEYAFEKRPPLDFKPGQLESDLNILDITALDYDDWVRLGQALHHQFGGAQEGFDLWLEHTKRSSKFTGDAQIRQMRRSKWRSFGRYRGQPVTMGTIRAWAQAARLDALVSDDLDDLDDPVAADDFDDLMTAPAGEVDDDDEAVFSKGLDTPDALPWRSLLAMNKDGEGLAANLHNLRLIVENDERTAGVMAFNEFTQEVVQRGLPGQKQTRRKNAAKPTLQLQGQSWLMRDIVNGDFWTDDKDNAIRAIIEAPNTQGGYSIKVPDRDLRAAVDIVARKNCFHPVREYLSGLTWDGVPRVESLFMDYLGAPDDAYTRSVGRLMMIAGVARVFEPGCKFDFAVILRGLQGARKSTFISVLAKSWFAELEGDFEDAKQMVEMMQGAWVLELPELGGFVRADVRHIKAFVSRRSDKVRLAYAKRAQEYHRQSIMIGSTNDDKFLKDDTGNRRFWLIHCCVEAIDTGRLESNVDQLWAEALQLYRQMRAAKPRGVLPLYLTDAESQDIAARLQESARVESADDAMAGQIGAWLDAPINTGDFDADTDHGKPVYRNETCLIELWVDCLGKDRGAYGQQVAQMLGRSMSRLSDWEADGRFAVFPKWGRQRVYDRGGRTGRLSRIEPN